MTTYTNQVIRYLDFPRRLRDSRHPWLGKIHVTGEHRAPAFAVRARRKAGGTNLTPTTLHFFMPPAQKMDTAYDMPMANLNKARRCQFRCPLELPKLAAKTLAGIFNRAERPRPLFYFAAVLRALCPAFGRSRFAATMSP